MSAADAPKAPEATKPDVVPPPMPTIDVSAAKVRLAASCMATHDIRYYLCGVRVEPRKGGGAYIIGCDGHRLLVCIDSTATCSEPAILRVTPDMLRRMPKPRRNGEVWPATTKGKKRFAAMLAAKQEPRLQTEKFRGQPALVLTNEQGLPAYVTADRILVEGQFPDWRRVIPDFATLERGTPDSYKFSYVAGPMAALASGGKYDVPVAIPYRQKGKTGSGIVFQIVGHEYAVLLVMPMVDSSVGAGPFTDVWSKELPKPDPKPAEPAQPRDEAAANEAAAEVAVGTTG